MASGRLVRRSRVVTTLDRYFLSCSLLLIAGCEWHVSSARVNHLQSLSQPMPAEAVRCMSALFFTASWVVLYVLASPEIDTSTCRRSDLGPNAAEVREACSHMGMHRL